VCVCVCLICKSLVLLCVIFDFYSCYYECKQQAGDVTLERISSANVKLYLFISYVLPGAEPCSWVIPQNIWCVRWMW